MNNHVKQSPMLSVLSLGGGSHSPLIRKPPAGGGGGGGTDTFPPTNNNLTNDKYINVMNTSLYASRENCGFFVDKYNTGKICIGSVAQAGNVNSINYGWGYHIAVYNNDGTLDWQYKYAFLQANVVDKNQTVVMDSSGNVYVFGFSQTVSSGNGHLPSMCKLDSSGNLQYGKFLNLVGFSSVTWGLGYYHASSFIYTKIDENDNIYHLVAVPDQNQNTFSTPKYIIKHNTSETIAWQYKIGMDGWSGHFQNGNAPFYQGFAVTRDGSAVYLLYKNAQDSGKIGLTKLDGSNGSIVWQKTFTGSYTDATGATQSFTADNGGIYNGQMSNSLYVDYSGNIYIAANSNNTKAFAVLKLDSSGTILWSRILVSNSSSVDANFCGNFWRCSIAADEKDGSQRIVAGHGSRWQNAVTGNSDDHNFYVFSKDGTIQYARTMYHNHTLVSNTNDNSGKREFPGQYEADGNGMFYLDGWYPSLGYDGANSWSMHADPGWIKHPTDTAVPTGDYGSVTSSGYTDSTRIQNFTGYTVGGSDTFTDGTAATGAVFTITTPNPLLEFNTASQCIRTGSQSTNNFDSETL